jgi:serine protease Do
VALLTALIFAAPGCAQKAGAARAAENPEAGPSGGAFVEIAKKVTHFVVNVSATRIIEHPPLEDSPFFQGPFEKYFKRFKDGESFEAEGLGSGVIFREDGYILTNNHVVEDASEIHVSIFENQVFTAEVVGRDPTTDLAVIRIEKTGLAAAPLGDSDRAEVGEWVMAVGSPMHLPFTVTAGIISAKGRNIDIIPGSYSIESFIQTDAAINPGNSGGPLVNLKGEVIGINTAISSQTGFYQGYGFAIPINLAKRVANDIIEQGKVVRPILGISIQDLTPARASEMSLENLSGVLVAGFVPERSPAQEAGLREGDLIVDIDGERVARVNELQTIVARHQPGDTVVVAVVRGKEELSFRIPLVEKIEGEEALAVNIAPDVIADPFGVETRELETQERDVHSLREDQGVIIDGLLAEGPAARAKPYALAPGDVILEVGNGMEVATPDEYEDALSELAGKDEILLYVSRLSESGVTRFFTVIEPSW